MTDFLIEAQKLPATDRYSFIYKSFTNLALGESLTIVNNHDPLPSLFQLTDFGEENFAHEYLEEGPTQWTVKIWKMKKEGCCGFCGS